MGFSCFGGLLGYYNVVNEHAASIFSSINFIGTNEVY